MLAVARPVKGLPLTARLSSCGEGSHRLRVEQWPGFSSSGSWPEGLVATLRGQLLAHMCGRHVPCDASLESVGLPAGLAYAEATGADPLTAPQGPANGGQRWTTLAQPLTLRMKERGGVFNLTADEWPSLWLRGDCPVTLVDLFTELLVARIGSGGRRAG